MTLSDNGKRIEVTVGSNGARSGSAERLADSVAACLHNAPVYFYKTAKAARKDSASCCSYDWNYKPSQRQTSR